MLIDPRKTRITLIWEEEAEIEETGITAKIEDITPQVTETVNVSNITGGM